MASPLERQIRRQIAAGFKGRLLTGTLWRYTPGEGTDPVGDPLPGSWASHSCEGVIEEYDDRYRAQAGIPQEDVKLVLIAGLLAVEPTKEDVVNMRGAWWQARAVKTDPAQASWTLQAYGVEKPAGID